MREIKFRAWDNSKDSFHKGMYYGVERAYDTLGSMTDTEGKEKDYSWSSFGGVLDEAKNGEIILMQYTGLRDENGKEIYEGDIIELMYAGRMITKVVEWSEEDTGWLWARLNPLSSVIIGNIYENPKLIR